MRCNREVRGERDLRADSDRPSPHRTHNRQLSFQQKWDQPIGLGGQTALNAGCARFGLARNVSADDVETTAEVLICAAHHDHP